METELWASILRLGNHNRRSSTIGFLAVANKESSVPSGVGAFAGDRLAEDAAAILHRALNSEWGFRCNWGMKKGS